MEIKAMLIVALIFSSSLTLLITLALICFCRRSGGCFSKDDESWDKEAANGVEMEMKGGGDLMRFEGGEDLTCFDVLDAPGEVIGKSSYGTLYRAKLMRSDSVVVLRFLRPACTGKLQDVMHVVQLLGSIRHPNLVPLCGFYVGPRGEKLLVHPFYRRGNLAQFITDGNGEYQKCSVIYRISIGIARGLYHLRTGLQTPIIHGNLKSRNILLGRNHQPFVSDFGLHLLLNTFAAQEVLEDAAVEGHEPPELSKTNDPSLEADIFNFGVILLELLTGQDFCSNSILDHQISDVYVNQQRTKKLYQLAIACCSPSPPLRPDVKHICRKLQEIGS